jgi:signal transduction histidine kinase
MVHFGSGLSELGINRKDRKSEAHFLGKKSKTPKGNSPLYKRHLRGAYVRGGASVALWFFALTAYRLRIIDSYSYAGISFSVLYLVLINPPTLWVLKRLHQRIRYQEYFSLSINALEVLGYTAVIYFAGGLSRSYLTMLYTALISYVGVMARRSWSFLIAGFCATAFTCMTIMEYYQIIPQTLNYATANIPLKRQVFECSVITGFLFLVTFITSSTSLVIKKKKNQLQAQNEALKSYQEKIEEAHQVLEEKNLALKAAMEQARASDRLKSEFLANMSHELRTPLNHIIGFNELVLSKNYGDLTPVQEDFLNDVLESSRHLLVLINDVLDLAKVEAGKLELELSLFPLQPLLEHSLIMIKEEAFKHRITLQTDFTDLPDWIRADERKLKQILYNLLSNAVKYTPDGGLVRLSAQGVQDGATGPEGPESPETGVRSEKEGDLTLRTQPGAPGCGFIKISIIDTGIGLKAEDLERIFNPFEQADNSFSRKYQGTGLGLSLAKKMIELHGGRIWAASDGQGKGSCFHFTLPLGKDNQDIEP